MIIRPGVAILDTPLQHVGYLDFRPPYSGPDQYLLPRTGHQWYWEVTLSDHQGDGVFDDVYIRGWHIDCGSVNREAVMLWTLIVLLLVFWALGLGFKLAAGAIHLLLVVALVLVVVNLVSGRRTTI